MIDRYIYRAQLFIFIYYYIWEKDRNNHFRGECGAINTTTTIKYNPNIGYKQIYMKLSPFVLFLVILFVLALSIIFGNWFQNEYAGLNASSKEGFLSYQSNLPYHGNVYLPHYSTKKPIHKLHDCLYYDFNNGAVVVINGEQKSNAADYRPDISGTTISSVRMYNRNGETAGPITYTSANFPSSTYESELSKENGLSLSYKCFNVVASVTSNITVPATPDVAGNANVGNAQVSASPSYVLIDDKYELVYIPWGRETFLHLIELKVADPTARTTTFVRNHKYTFAYNSTGQIIETYDVNNKTTGLGVANYPASTESTFKLVNTYSDSHVTTNDGVYTTTDKYVPSRHLYQLCNNIRYDKKNGYVISTNKSDNLFVYPRKKITSSSRFITPDVYNTTPDSAKPLVLSQIDNAIPSTNGFNVGVFNSVNTDSTESDPTAQSLYTIIYIAIGRRTILASLKATTANDNKTYDIHKIVRIDSTGQIDNGTQIYKPQNDEPDSQDKIVTEYDGKDRTAFENLMRYWFIQNSDYDASTINDYMLKTQIVPPVCPRCPSCPSSGVCYDCGGKGGSGTKGGNDKDDKDRDNGRRNILRDTGSGATNLIRDTGSGATNLIRDTGSGANRLLRDTASETVGLAKETVGGAVGLAKETVGGAVGLAKETVGGVVNTFGRLAPTQVSNINMPSNAQQSQSYYTTQPGQNVNTVTGSDHPSYFGALVPKGGDYIPVTADFSRFGR